MKDKVKSFAGQLELSQILDMIPGSFIHKTDRRRQLTGIIKCCHWLYICKPSARRGGRYPQLKIDWQFRPVWRAVAISYATFAPGMIPFVYWPSAVILRQNCVWSAASYRTRAVTRMQHWWPDQEAVVLQELTGDQERSYNTSKTGNLIWPANL